MKQFYIISAIFFLSCLAYGQDKEGLLYYKSIDTNYTWRTALNIQIDSFYYNIKPVQFSNKTNHIRIYLTGQIIDISINKKKQYQGFLINEITQYISEESENEDYEHSVSNQIVFEKIQLKETSVKSVFKKIMTSKQNDLPTDSLINNWNSRFLHCSSICFQFNINGVYKNQKYFCPWGQNDTVIGKTTIINNYNLIYKVLSLDSLYSEFENKLPKGKTYSCDGYKMIYKMTNSQIDNWESAKPKRDYMHSVKDTIDNYLETKLSNNKVELKNISCFEDYRITIGKNGKLKKITISEYNKPKIKTSLNPIDYFVDKKEIRKCKSKIRKTFKEIDLSFLKLKLKLKYEIYRTISINIEEEFILRDDTIY